MSSPTTTAPPVFVPVRDLAVAVGRLSQAADLATIDQALAEADTALSVGPILDPTLARNGAAELERQVRLIRALRAFRAEVEELRP